MANKIFLVILLFSSCLCANAQNQPGKIVFYRESHSKGNDPSIFCDGQELAHIARGSYIEITAPSGRHPCVAESLQESATYVLVMPGQTAYQMVEVQNRRDPQASLITSSEREFKGQKGLKPIEPGQKIALPAIETPGEGPLPEGVFQSGAKGVGFPRCVSCPNPGYTEKGRHAKVQGSIVLIAVIGPDGRAGNLKILQRLGLGMDEAAVDTVRSWVFEPARGPNGDPVPTQVPIEIAFRLF